MRMVLSERGIYLVKADDRTVNIYTESHQLLSQYRAPEQGLILDAVFVRDWREALMETEEKVICVLATLTLDVGSHGQ